MVEIITYESLYEFLRNEKYKPELQKLEQTFFSDVTKYLKEKDQILISQENKDSIFAQQEIIKTKKQIENIKKILKEIYEKRELKIIQLALIQSRTGITTTNIPNMLSEEEHFYNNLLQELNTTRKNILHNLTSAKMPEISKPKELKTNSDENKVIKFLIPVPKFVGTDLKTYGPFNEENIASLPDKVADLLIKNRRAEELKI